MPSLSPYKSSLDYSYAPGLFPSVECLLHRPDCAMRVLLQSDTEDSEGAEKLQKLAGDLQKRWEYADRILRNVSGKENCHAAVVFRKFSDELSADKPHVVLHNPGDTGNVGTILRTALGFGYEDIALIRPCVDVFDPRTVRSSMGSLFSLRLHVFDSFEAYRAVYPEHLLYPFMLRHARPLETVIGEEVPPRFALVFGNEGRGLPDAFADEGRPVRIESNERIDSLNLSVAAAIGLYRFAQKAGMTP